MGLHERLRVMADTRGQSPAQFAGEILAAADRLRDNFDSEPSDPTRFIRRCNDGGCGSCDDLELWLRHGSGQTVGTPR